MVQANKLPAKEGEIARMMTRTMTPVRARFSACLFAACALSLPAAAQSLPPPGSGDRGGQPPASRPPAPVAQKAPSAPAKAPAVTGKSTGDAPGGGSEGQLRQRVEQLEEQLVDLQVAIGTLESLGRAGPGGPPRGASTASFGGPEAGRIAALETQVQALTAQVEQMSDQMRAFRGAPAAAAGGTYRSQPNAAPPAAGFGAATVTPAGADPIGQLINTAEPRPAAIASAPLPPLGSSAGSRQLYEQAYGQLLQQNLPAAEAGLSEFLQRYPNDELAANAQFWLAETYFQRSQWDAAAEAFLKVVKTYGNSVKAPDSLAKLAMSFERKGNKQAACRALAELNSRYPNPPAHVKTWESAERRKAGCV